MPSNEMPSAKFLEEFELIVALPEKVSLSKLNALNDLLFAVIDDIIKKDTIFFNTLFSKITFLKQKLGLSSEIAFSLNHFRISFQHIHKNEDVSDKELGKLIELGQNLLVFLFITFYKIELPYNLPSTRDVEWLKPQYNNSSSKAIPFLKGLIYKIDVEKHLIYFLADWEDDDEILVHFNVLNLNEVYTDTIIHLHEIGKLPVSCMLVNVKMDDNGIFLPTHFVLEPDYLFDVTAIAHCFESKGGNPDAYLLKKFSLKSTTTHLLIGEIANFFLDALISNPSLSFDYLFPLVFKKNPLSFALISDDDLLKIIESSKNIFRNLLKTITKDFPIQQILPKHCYLEPSFLSEIYGIQGRLDLLFEGSDRTVIVELKSGKTYQTNDFGINIPHFYQFLLYDLIIQSPTSKKRVAGFVLYAGESVSLRFAPSNLLQQQKAMVMRNNLLFIELSLINLGFQENLLSAGEAVFQPLFDQLSEAKGFFKTDLNLFISTLNEASTIEKKYFYSFISFIAREQKLAKSGSGNYQNGSKGQASLWLESVKDKKENFDILNHLALHAYQDNQITFLKTEKTANRANFRVGDTLILYPSLDKEQFTSDFQLFKVYLLAIEKNEIIVSLMFPQHDDSFFRQFSYWNLEPDFFDSFHNFDQSLFRFLSAEKLKRNLYLGLIPPSGSDGIEIQIPENNFCKMTDEQRSLLHAIIHSKDYFLLWGPPGTGKTSIMIRNLVAHYFYATDENIMLLAFTNRAVDEICEAVESIGGDIKDNYLRIGHVQSSAIKFRANIFKNKCEKIKSRKELLKLIGDSRIFISTLTSLQKNMDFLKLKKFHRIMVDEASQLPDPAMAGILVHFPHFLLIGDHKQLPAVVLQSQDQSEVKDHDLLTIGFHDLRDSVFERMIKRVEKMNWHWALGKLSFQGRMHREIMTFPGFHFYSDMLKVLPEYADKQKKLIQPLPALSFNFDSEIAWNIQSSRVCFFSTKIDLSDASGKSNQFEAIQIGQIVLFFQQYFKEQHRALTASDIGIITPYRAQIACIREYLISIGLDISLFTIDTVERYQGSARSIIIYSPCLNYPRQLSTLVSKNTEGVDRKLNVAITRAREHFIMVGNAELLKKSPDYANLISYAASMA
ncbi:MAG: AAA domain-containing protein [Saprospiraceae bacterium]